MKNKRRQREEPCAICQHYHDYEGGEPCSICGHKLVVDTASAVPPSVLPSEIMPGFLFLGSYDHASRQELLKTLGIEYILNSVPSAMNLYKTSFEYYQVAANPPNLEECCAFLEQVRAAGKKVLIHCMSGTSRSPSIVIYYLMRVHRLPLNSAFQLVKEKRPSVAFNADDAASLQAAEVMLLGGHASGFQVPIEKTTGTAHSVGLMAVQGAANAVAATGGGGQLPDGASSFVMGA